MTWIKRGYYSQLDKCNRLGCTWQLCGSSTILVFWNISISVKFVPSGLINISLRKVTVSSARCIHSMHVRCVEVFVVMDI